MSHWISNRVIFIQFDMVVTHVSGIHHCHYVCVNWLNSNSVGWQFDMQIASTHQFPLVFAEQKKLLFSPLFSLTWVIVREWWVLIAVTGGLPRTM